MSEDTAGRSVERIGVINPCRCGHEKGDHQLRLGQRRNYTPCCVSGCSCDGFRKAQVEDLLRSLATLQAERDEAQGQLELAEAERSSSMEAAVVLLAALGWSSGGLGSAAHEIVKERDTAVQERDYFHRQRDIICALIDNPDMEIPADSGIGEGVKAELRQLEHRAARAAVREWHAIHKQGVQTLRVWVERAEAAERALAEAQNTVRNYEAALRGVHGIEFEDGTIVNVAALEHDLAESQKRIALLEHALNNCEIHPGRPHDTACALCFTETSEALAEARAEIERLVREREEALGRWREAQAVTEEWKKAAFSASRAMNNLDSQLKDRAELERLLTDTLNTLRKQVTP